MNGKIGDKKIGGVNTTRETSQVDRAQEVGGVEETRAIGQVRGAGSVGDRRRPTRVMTAEEREKFFKMVDEEADRLFGSNALSPKRRELVKQAVKMAVDSGLLPEDDDKKRK